MIYQDHALPLHLKTTLASLFVGESAAACTKYGDYTEFIDDLGHITTKVPLRNTATIWNSSSLNPAAAGQLGRGRSVDAPYQTTGFRRFIFHRGVPIGEGGVQCHRLSCQDSLGRPSVSRPPFPCSGAGVTAFGVWQLDLREARRHHDFQRGSLCKNNHLNLSLGTLASVTCLFYYLSLKANDRHNFFFLTSFLVVDLQQCNFQTRLNASSPPASLDLFADVRTVASSHCLPSPDGNYIATLFASVVNVRAVRSLEVVNVVKLPQDFSGPVLGFQWSPSSRLLLVAGIEQIRVCSALDNSFNATVRNPVPAGTRPAHVGFGASDTEICVISSFGLKLSVFDLTSSKASEIANPKFSSPSTASRGFSFRPGTRHLALLTRSAGKDMISVHDYPARQLRLSWAPDTIDAQGVLWSPDGRWLVVWESPALGHKVIFYTADGHLFKSWTGPANPAPEDKDYALGAGVKLVRFSADGHRLSIGDCSKSISMFDMTTAMEGLRLQHPTTIMPRDTLQVCRVPSLNTTQCLTYSRSGRKRLLLRRQDHPFTLLFGLHKPFPQLLDHMTTQKHYLDVQIFCLTHPRGF